MNAPPSRTITEITRRDIRRSLLREGIAWYGELTDTEFLSRLYDLETLPSIDSRFQTASEDIWQHRIRNMDWDEDWVFNDERFQLSDGPDEIYLNFLAEIVHPTVLSDRDKAKMVVGMLNQLLEPDGWKLVEKSSISGRPIYSGQRLNSTQHISQAAHKAARAFDEDYIHQQVNRMTSSLDADPELAIGTAKELIETCCRSILSDRGKPVTDRPELLPLVRRVLEDLHLLPDGIDDQLKGAKTIKSLLGTLATISQSLAELRNLYGTGHGKNANRKGLTSRHARLAVGAATTLVHFLFDTHQERTSST